MKKILIVLSILLFNTNLCIAENEAHKHKLKITNYYSMAANAETKITKWDGEHLNLMVYEVDEGSNYPVGTEFIGTVVERQAARRLNRDEYLMVQINKAIYPDGQVKTENLKFKVQSRGFLNSERMANVAVGATAITLGTIFDATVVGLPISRGGYALWYSAQEIRNREEGSSKLKAGAIGFAKGAIFPIPQLIAKGRNLDAMAVGSRVSIDEETSGRSIDAYLKV